MRLLELIELLEARLDVLQAKWADQLNLKAQGNPQEVAAARQQGGDIFNILAKTDPTGNKQFLQWLITLYMRDAFKIEDAYKITEPLALFQKFKPKLPNEARDLNRYKSVDELYNVVAPFEKQQTQREVNKKLDAEMHGEKNAKILHNDKELKILIPLNRKASCYFGVNTKWCTAADQSNNMFDHYNRDGPLYVILHKPTNRRWQFHFESGQFMNEQDRQIDLFELVVREIPKIREVFGDKIDEAIIRANPERIMSLPDSSDEIKNLAVELKPELITLGGFVDEPTPGQLLSAIGSSPKLFSQLATDDEEHRYQEMRDVVQDQNAEPDEIEHGVGSIQHHYETRGMTPDLLMRIIDAFDNAEAPIRGYSASKKAFIAETWKNLDEFVKEELGETAQWALGVMTGEQSLEQYDISPDSREAAFDALDAADRRKIGQHILNQMVAEEHVDITDEGDVYLSGYDIDDAVSYDPASWSDIEWLLDETGDPSDFKSGFTSAAFSGEEMGAEAEMSQDFHRYIDDIDPEISNDLYDEQHDALEGLAAWIYRTGQAWDTNPVHLMIGQEEAIEMISEVEMWRKYLEGWTRAYTYKDLEQPYYGWSGFDEFAAAESLKDHFYEAFKE